jgi:hypothetical protein
MKRLFFLSLLLVSYTAVIGEAGASPSCYNEKIPVQKLAVETEIFVVIDQTTLFDGHIKQLIANNVRPFLKPGNAFSVTQFSAFIQSHYTDVLVSGKLDPALTKATRDDVSKPVLNKFDQCMAMQPRLAGQLVGKAMRAAFEGGGSDIAKSDILAALKDISGKVRQSSARHKVVLLASDMLENSSVTSFYSKQAVRQINPEKELKLVSDNQLFGDFGGARVYVLGAGMLAEDAKHPGGVYRPSQTMQALFRFWAEYFKKSNAELIEFGQPALLNPIH